MDVVKESPRYAVLFRTHMWDPFVERQFHRLRAHVKDADVFVVANNTSGKCEVPPDLPVVAFKESDLERMGLAKGGVGGMVWYNVDYPLYYFKCLYNDYNYYVMIEYDVVINIPLDHVIARAFKSGRDLVGLTKGDPFGSWWFRSTCLEVYSEADVRKMLLPIGIFSSRAVEYLFERRIQMSDMLRRGAINSWPHCEAFIPTELTLAGFDVDELVNYGSTNHYSHQPAYLEQDAALLQNEAFVHPVLDTPRYIESVIKYEWKPERFFLPSSDIRNKLSRFHLREYMLPLGLALHRRFRKLVSKSARKLHLPAAIINPRPL